MFDVLPRRPARLPARADPAAGAERQLVQALRRRLVRPDRGRVGATTTAPARCASSATGRRCGSRTGPAASDLNPYLALSAIIAAGLHGVEQGLELEPPLRGQRLPGPRQAAAARDAARRARAVRLERGRPRGFRRRGGRPLRQRRRRRAGGIRRRRSPTGSGCGGSSGCERRGCRGRWRQLGRRGVAARAGSPRRRGVRAGALADGVRGDGRAPRHRDQAGPAATRHSAAGRARAVHEARASRARRCARRSWRSAQSGHLRATRGRGGGTFVADPQPPAAPPSRATARRLARCVRRAHGRRARGGGAGHRAGRAGDARRARRAGRSRSTACSRTSPPTARPTSACTWASRRRPAPAAGGAR